MSFPVSRLAVLSACILMMACSGPGKEAPPRAQLLFSPNGEPITGGPLGQPSCAEAMGSWFDRLDAGHAGKVGHDAFMDDARHQFARMDLNHDGWVTPAELSEYRAPYAPPPEPVRRGGGGPQGAGSLAGAQGGGRGDGAPPPVRSSVVQEDPVMSADTALKFRVSLEDFLAQAEEVFKRLDRGGKGGISRADAVASCPAKISARQILPGKPVV